MINNKKRKLFYKNPLIILLNSIFLFNNLNCMILNKSKSLLEQSAHYVAKNNIEFNENDIPIDLRTYINNLKEIYKRNLPNFLNKKFMDLISTNSIEEIKQSLELIDILTSNLPKNKVALILEEISQRPKYDFNLSPTLIIILDILKIDNKLITLFRTKIEKIKTKALEELNLNQNNIKALVILNKIYANIDKDHEKARYCLDQLNNIDYTTADLIEVKNNPIILFYKSNITTLFENNFDKTFEIFFEPMEFVDPITLQQQYQLRKLYIKKTLYLKNSINKYKDKIYKNPEDYSIICYIILAHAYYLIGDKIKEQEIIKSILEQARTTNNLVIFKIIYNYYISTMQSQYITDEIKIKFRDYNSIINQANASPVRQL